MSPEAYSAALVMGRPVRIAQDIAGGVLFAMLVLFSVWALLQSDGRPPRDVLDASNHVRQALR